MKKGLPKTTASPEAVLGIEKLEPKDQDTFRREEQLLTEAAQKLEMSSMEIGEHLSNISKILAPKRMFNKWLEKWCANRKNKVGRSWAYQLMKDYEGVKSKLPKPLLQMALDRGTKLTPQLLVQNPPPQTTDKSAINKYLESVEHSRVVVIKTPEILLKETVNFFCLRFDQLPNNHKTRASFTRSVIGMIMAKSGISAQAFEPQAIPETFKRQVGRPVGSFKKAA